MIWDGFEELTEFSSVWKKTQARNSRHVCSCTFIKDLGGPLICSKSGINTLCRL